MNNYNNYEIGDVLNAIGILLGYQNLCENRAQSEYNDVHKANDEQAERLLAEIERKFDVQNIMLKGIRETINYVREMVEGMAEVLDETDARVDEIFQRVIRQEELGQNVERV